MSKSLILALMIFTNAALANLERPVTLKSKVEVSSQNICLQDLTDAVWIKSRCTFDSKNCCRWNLSGSTSAIFRRVDLQKSLDGLDFGGISVRLTTEVENKTDEILVTQTKKEISNLEIKEKVENWIKSRNLNSDEKIEVLSVKTPLSLFVAADQPNYQIEFPEHIGEVNNIKIIGAGSSNETLGFVEVRTSKKISALVARRNIRPNELIKPEDFENKLITAGNENQEMPYTNENFPEGVRARLSIRAGSTLTAQSIEKTPLVRLGDSVNLILKSDNLKISTKGVAQGSAAVGDMVSVQLPRYNRSFRGKLQDSKTVEVWF